MRDVLVLLRVFDRIDDLRVCLRLIREGWTRNRYQVLIVSNGREAGHAVPRELLGDGVELAELTDNPGHALGNSRLLMHGVAQLPERASHVVLLEADTWLFDDALIVRYLDRMERSGAGWASAAWLERFHSLALDFALLDADILREHPGLLDFELHPECHVANVLNDLGVGYELVKELMPVHVPRLVRELLPHTAGRFRCFPEGPMVTHHVEDLPGGMEQKLREANWTAGKAWFEVSAPGDIPRENRRLRRGQRLARWAPRSGWLRPRVAKRW